MMARVNTLNPNHFALMKGRGGRYYCKLCTTAGHSHGQPMTLEAALRHEAGNAKHLAKVEETRADANANADEEEDEWGYQPNCDWGPTPVPEGSSAWEQSYPCDRVQDLIPWWQENVAAAMRGEEVETMDTFIDRFNKTYQDWVDGWKDLPAKPDVQADPEVAEPEEWDEGWDGVPGQWYTGGSFLPYDDGGEYDQPLRPAAAPQRRPTEAVRQDATNLWGADTEEDPYVVWGIPRDQDTPWTPAPVPVTAVHQSSDATPHDPPSNSGVSPKTGPYRLGRRRKHRGRAYGAQQKQGLIVDGATGRPDSRRNQKATIY